MAVSTIYQRRGIGQRLMDDALEECRIRRRNDVKLTTLHLRQQAIALYERNSFVQYHQEWNTLQTGWFHIPMRLIYYRKLLKQRYKIAVLENLECRTASIVGCARSALVHQSLATKLSIFMKTTNCIMRTENAQIFSFAILKIECFSFVTNEGLDSKLFNKGTVH